MNSELIGERVFRVQWDHQPQPCIYALQDSSRVFVSEYDYGIPGNNVDPVPNLPMSFVDNGDYLYETAVFHTDKDTWIADWSV